MHVCEPSVSDRRGAVAIGGTPIEFFLESRAIYPVEREDEVCMPPD